MQHFTWKFSYYAHFSHCLPPPLSLASSRLPILLSGSHLQGEKSTPLRVQDPGVPAIRAPRSSVTPGCFSPGTPHLLLGFGLSLELTVQGQLL